MGYDTLRLAVEASPAGMLTVGGDGIIVMANGEIERLFGYGRDELLGQPVDMLLPENLRARHVSQRTAFMRAPHARHLGSGRDFTGRRKDGSEVPIEIGLNPMRLGNETVLLCAIIDVSARKRLAQMQNEFVATVSHELRTPMTAIAAPLGLLLAGSTSGLPQPAAHLLEIAHTNCLRLVRMVSDILDLQKLDSAHMAFRFERCAARGLLERAIEANRAFANDVGIRLKAPPALGDVYVDPDRFIQLITNLLSNAFKFSPPGETVVVEAGRRRGGIRIAVRDRGPGIPEKFKPRVFEKFAQGHGHKGGSGLGLSIARELATRMQGQIGFDDAPGGGTIFHVDLPSADRAAQWQAELAEAPAPSHAGLAAQAS